MTTHRTAASEPSRRGTEPFTLVELLVVCAILVLLCLLVTMARGRTRENARRENCARTLRSITYASKMYAGDNMDHFPAADSVPGVQTEEESVRDFQILITHKYLDAMKAYTCPSTSTAFSTDTRLESSELDYVYFGRAQTERSVSTETVVIADGTTHGNHVNYGNVVYGDGHKAFLRGATWRQQTNTPLGTGRTW